ncbi:MAG: Rieske (2Fe-2S) protein [Paracoccaceae bacterium]|nr:Rieske (2Fe-2S) protein [Paracoccaceae bacterium]
MPPPPVAWTPVALAADLQPGAAAGVVVDGAEVAIWRDTAGTPHAWEDRCPHRGMKLSFGFVRGERLACLYHGWEYDGGGQCRYIPAHPDLDVPASICVNRYSAADAAGLLWVASGTGSGDLPDPGDPLSPLRSLFIDAPLGEVLNRLAADGLPGLGPVVESAEDGPLLNFDQAGHRFVVGRHPTGPSGTALHILLKGEVSAEARAAMIPATAELRRLAEAGR